MIWNHLRDFHGVEHVCRHECDVCLAYHSASVRCQLPARPQRSRPAALCLLERRRLAPPTPCARGRSAAVPVAERTRRGFAAGASGLSHTAENSARRGPVHPAQRIAGTSCYGHKTPRCRPCTDGREHVLCLTTGITDEKITLISPPAGPRVERRGPGIARRRHRRRQQPARRRIGLLGRDHDRRQHLGYGRLHRSPRQELRPARGLLSGLRQRHDPHRRRSGRTELPAPLRRRRHRGRRGREHAGRQLRPSATASSKAKPFRSQASAKWPAAIWPSRSKTRPR